MNFSFRQQPGRPLLADLAILMLVAITALIWLAPVWTFADLFRQVWPVWAAFAALTIVLLASLRQWAHLTLAILPGVLIFTPVGSEFWRSQTEPYSYKLPGDAVVLTVATHNVWGRNSDPEQTIGVLQNF